MSTSARARRARASWAAPALWVPGPSRGARARRPALHRPGLPAVNYACLRSNGAKCCLPSATWTGCLACPADAVRESGGVKRACPTPQGGTACCEPRTACRPALHSILLTPRCQHAPRPRSGPSKLYGCAGEAFDRSNSRLMDWSYAGYMWVGLAFACLRVSAEMRHLRPLEDSPELVQAVRLPARCP